MNKKKIFGSIAVLAIAVIAAFNVNINRQEDGLSDISLDNVEALAWEFGGDPQPGTYCDLDCIGGGMCWMIRPTWGLPCERTGNPYDYCKC